jgi:UDP-N-acetylmuramoyl-tripeptide--D-alanyl-D-alanine ligase
MRFLASDIARAVGGDLVGPDVEVDGARHDSREILGGELFVPLVDQRDGHDFIPTALAAGAAAYFTAREPQGSSAIVVPDPAQALAALGMHARSNLAGPVVGVTGSVGKTSCKDLAAATLGMRFETHSSLRSFNNELGVPLTLINAPDATEATVIEMGARGLGHIDQLCEVARPSIGVVTTVEAVHTELFGDLSQVALAKGELIERLPRTGTAILNRDNEHVAAMVSRAAGRVLLFGTSDAPDIDVRATGIVLDKELRPTFVLDSPWGRTEVQLGVRGEHQVMNALAAAAVGLVCEVTLDEVVQGLATAELSPWRMELHTAPSGALVLNDAYNAGPASMEAALRALAQLDAGRRISVLGPMAELGDQGRAAHRRITAIASELGIEVVAVGAPDYGDGAEHVATIAAALEHVGNIGDGDAVLVKGSRVAGLEQLAHALLAG